MVEIAPLRGLVYSPEHLEANVLAPPYDVIEAKQRGELLAQSDYNVVRLILPEPSAGPEWHAQAGARLREWQRSHVLLRDSTPSIYGYRQYFGSPERMRTGFVARLRLVPWGQGVYRHEHTHSAPKADRLRLMRAARANLSPVFGLYNDPDGELSRYLEPPERPLLDSYVDGVRQVFWRLDERSAQHLVQGMMNREVVIADGHHRYETALAYQQERREAEGWPSAVRPYDYVLIYLTALQDPGLVILPTHRILKQVEGFDARRFLAVLREDFSLEPVGEGVRLGQAVATANYGTIAFGLCLRGLGSFVLGLRQPAEELARAGQDGELTSLDAWVFQEAILRRRLGMTAEALAEQGSLGYTTSEDEACAGVKSGEAEAAFILRPTRVEQVWRVAKAGLTMPQKSTYFYPKLLTGLVINPLDGE